MSRSPAHALEARQKTESALDSKGDSVASSAHNPHKSSPSRLSQSMRNLGIHSSDLKTETTPSSPAIDSEAARFAASLDKDVKVDAQDLSNTWRNAIIIGAGKERGWLIQYFHNAKTEWLPRTSTRIAPYGSRTFSATSFASTAAPSSNSPATKVSTPTTHSPDQQRSLPQPQPQTPIAPARRPSLAALSILPPAHPIIATIVPPSPASSLRSDSDNSTTTLQEQSNLQSEMIARLLNENNSLRHQLSNAQKMTLLLCSTPSIDNVAELVLMSVAIEDMIRNGSSEKLRQLKVPLSQLITQARQHQAKLFLASPAFFTASSQLMSWCSNRLDLLESDGPNAVQLTVALEKEYTICEVERNGNSLFAAIARGVYFRDLVQEWAVPPTPDQLLARQLAALAQLQSSAPPSLQWAASSLRGMAAQTLSTTLTAASSAKSDASSARQRARDTLILVQNEIAMALVDSKSTNPTTKLLNHNLRLRMDEKLVQSPALASQDQIAQQVYLGVMAQDGMLVSEPMLQALSDALQVAIHVYSSGESAVSLSADRPLPAVVLGSHHINSTIRLFRDHSHQYSLLIPVPHAVSRTYIQPSVAAVTAAFAPPISAVAPSSVFPVPAISNDRQASVDSIARSSPSSSPPVPFLQSSPLVESPKMLRPIVPATVGGTAASSLPASLDRPQVAVASKPALTAASSTPAPSFKAPIIPDSVLAALASPLPSPPKSPSPPAGQSPPTPHAVVPPTVPVTPVAAKEPAIAVPSSPALTSTIASVRRASVASAAPSTPSLIDRSRPVTVRPEDVEAAQKAFLAAGLPAAGATAPANVLGLDPSLASVAVAVGVLPPIVLGANHTTTGAAPSNAQPIRNHAHVPTRSHLSGQSPTRRLPARSQRIRHSREHSTGSRSPDLLHRSRDVMLSDAAPSMTAAFPGFARPLFPTSLLVPSTVPHGAPESHAVAPSSPPNMPGIDPKLLLTLSNINTTAPPPNPTHLARGQDRPPLLLHQRSSSPARHPEFVKDRSSYHSPRRNRAASADEDDDLIPNIGPVAPIDADPPADDEPVQADLDPLPSPQPSPNVFHPYRRSSAHDSAPGLPRKVTPADIELSDAEYDYVESEIGSASRALLDAHERKLYKASMTSFERERQAAKERAQAQLDLKLERSAVARDLAGITLNLGFGSDSGSPASAFALERGSSDPNSRLSRVFEQDLKARQREAAIEREKERREDRVRYASELAFIKSIHGPDMVTAVSGANIPTITPTFAPVVGASLPTSASLPSLAALTPAASSAPSFAAPILPALNLSNLLTTGAVMLPAAPSTPTAAPATRGSSNTSSPERSVEAVLSGSLNKETRTDQAPIKLASPPPEVGSIMDNIDIKLAFNQQVQSASWSLSSTLAPLFEQFARSVGVISQQLQFVLLPSNTILQPYQTVRSAIKAGDTVLVKRIK